MRKTALIMFGSPGSGKGQQADLLSDALGIIHVDTGKILRAIFADPRELKDPVVRKEKKLNDAGILNTPSWVVSVLRKKIDAIAKLGYGIVFSGSPRTLYEAEKVFPILEKLYGKKNVNVFFLKVPFAVAARRNRDRYVCGVCRRPLLTRYYPTRNPKRCPVCAGELVRRIDDDPEKFATRTREYEERTKPVIDFTRRRGYTIHEVDGTPAPYKVFQHIAAQLNGTH